MQRLVVDALGIGVGVIVREIGAGQHERVVIVAQNLGQGHAQRAAALVALVAHHNRHQLKVAQDLLQPRQLHLDRMLRCIGSGLVALVRELDGRAHLHQPSRKLFIDGNLPERRGVHVAVVHRSEVEAHVVRGRNHHHARVLVAPLYLGSDRRVGPRGHGSGIRIAGMRSHRGDDRAVNRRRRGLRQQVVDHLRKLLRIGGIE